MGNGAGAAAPLTPRVPTLIEVARARLRTQGITHPIRGTPAEIVRRLLAVQAQDYLGAKWGIGLRLRGATDAAVDRAVNSDAIIRTHVLRPTWHFVHADDIRWLLALTGPRVLAANAPVSRRLGLDARTLAKAHGAIACALEGGRSLTRDELAVAIERAGVHPAAGQRLAYIVMHAEQVALICSGPRRGKQFTYALMDERVPLAPPVARDEALARLARRFFAGHGPATVHDLARWASLTVAESRKAAGSVRDEFATRVIGGREFLFSGAGSLGGGRTDPRAHLLCIYDEYIAGYRHRAGIISDENRRTISGRGAAVGHVFVIGTEVLGTWSRTFTGRETAIRIEPFGRLTRAHRALLDEAAAAFGRFMELTPRVTVR